MGNFGWQSIVERKTESVSFGEARIKQNTHANTNSRGPLSSQQFANANCFNNDLDQELFVYRGKMLNEVGAGDIFTGNGTTENLTGKGTKGALEVLTIQHNPTPVKEMVSGQNPAAKMIKLW